MKYKLLALSQVKPERKFSLDRLIPKVQEKNLTFITLQQSTAEIPFQTNSYWVIPGQ